LNRIDVSIFKGNKLINIKWKPMTVLKTPAYNLKSSTRKMIQKWCTKKVRNLSDIEWMTSSSTPTTSTSLNKIQEATTTKALTAAMDNLWEGELFLLRRSRQLINNRNQPSTCNLTASHNTQKLLLMTCTMKQDSLTNWWPNSHNTRINLHINTTKMSSKDRMIMLLKERTDSSTKRILDSKTREAMATTDNLTTMSHRDARNTIRRAQMRMVYRLATRTTPLALHLAMKQSSRKAAPTRISHRQMVQLRVVQIAAPSTTRVLWHRILAMVARSFRTSWSKSWWWNQVNLAQEGQEIKRKW